MVEPLTIDTERAAASSDTNVSAEDAAEIQSLVAAYFQRTDRPSERAVADLFAPDGALILGPLRLEGRQAIATFFANRNTEQAETGRVTRHVHGGIELLARGIDCIEGHSATLVFAGTGVTPLPSALPTTICDFDDVYVRNDGNWLFQERRATVVFTGAGAATFAK